MANARNINQIREELRQHAGRLETLAQALEGESDAGAIVLSGRVGDTRRALETDCQRGSPKLYQHAI